jgi:uncharacterized protein (DUF1501 family)
MKRRTFLTAGLSAIASIGSHTGLTQGWIAQAAPSAAPSPQVPPQRLIVVLLRGAVDGLSVVVPYREQAYYKARPRIAIAPPGSDGGALDLDGRFGLHPALQALMPLWRQGHLAFIPASGSPDPTRSHFDAQDYLETATPGEKNTADGWMNRLLGILSPNPQALNLGKTLPRILAGSHAVTSLAPGQRSLEAIALDRQAVGNAFDRLYSGDDPLSKTYQAGRRDRQQLLASLADVNDPMMAEMNAADRGAPSAQGFVADARRLAQLLVRNPQMQLAFVALGGWDTHINQGSGRGLLANRLKPLGDGLGALVKGLGEASRHTTIVVMSEFGRTVAENGNGGTDHGHGNTLWVLGGSLATPLGGWLGGGQIHGPWPGLADGDLYERRDLAITTDFRTAIAPILRHHFHLTPEQMAQVFPHAGRVPGVNT